MGAEPSPQRTPVIYQAGASPRGVRFASENAEAIFVAAPSKEVLAGTVKRIRDAGMTVLIVEQRMAECLEIADRAYILQTGRVLMQGAASEIKGNPDVRKAYLGL